MLIIGNTNFSPGFKGTDQLLKGAQLPSTKETIRQASVSKEKNQASEPDPAADERPASYGVASDAETHTDNRTRERRREARQEDASRSETNQTNRKAASDPSVGRQVDTEA